MENRTLKIFVSCALGAGIGALIALQLNHYFWWIGILVGGFIGYMSYEFRNVLQAISVARESVTSWKPNKLYWKCAGLVILADLCFVSIFFVPFASIFVFFAGLREWVAVMISFLLMWFMLTLTTLVPIGDFSDHKRERRIKELRHELKMFNPISLYFYWLPVGIFGIIISTPQAVMAIGRFVKILFLLIHSDIRLLCGVEAAIGACVGYFAGSAIIGAVAGGIFGVINYELISKRMLGIIPTRRE